MNFIKTLGLPKNLLLIFPSELEIPKRNDIVLTQLLCYLTCIVNVIYILVNHFVLHESQAIWINFLILFFCCAAIALNQIQLFFWGKCVVISGANLGIFLGTRVEPYETGSYMFYFLLVLVSFALFDYSERKVIFGFVTISIVLFFLSLETTPSKTQFSDSYIFTQFVMNMSVCFVMIGIIFYYKSFLQHRYYSHTLNTDYKKKLMEAQFLSLRSQINPHFIFNCLNSIDHFVTSNEAGLASDYLAKFSKLIRLLLDQTSEKFVPLSKELETINLYIDLQQLRFNSRINYKVDLGNIDPETVLIPPMTIQPFVENSIIHGLMPKMGVGGNINIAFSLKDSSYLVCVIEDDGIGYKKSRASKARQVRKSFGISLVEKRLKLIQNKDMNQRIAVNDLDNGNGASGTIVFIYFDYINTTINLDVGNTQFND